MPEITTCLWFESNAADAVEHYVAIFPDSRIHSSTRYGEGDRLPAGTVLTIDFELAGRRFTALNGGPHHPFNDAMSLVVSCADQDEIDHYWERLLDGGQPMQCGWLRDRFGVSWQIVPAELADLLASEDPRANERVRSALQSMVRLDLTELRTAAGRAERRDR